MTEIQNIIKSLDLGLPGKEAQYKMAPSGRTIEDQALNLNNVKKSAVMALLFHQQEQLHVLLTQRAYYDGPHGGQISFPGGKFEKDADRDLKDTAIRETFEEIKLESQYFEVLGELSTLNIPISKVFIQPYIAYCKDIDQAQMDNYEVVDLYKVPFSLFSDPEAIKWKKFKDFEYPYYDFNGKVIWGATAMMLSELAVIVSRSEQF